MQAAPAFPLLVGLALLAGACGDDVPLPDPSGPPLLAARSDGKHACSLERPLARLFSAGWLGGSLLSDGQDWSVLSAEEARIPGAISSRILVRSIDDQGTASLPREIALVGAIRWHFGGTATAHGKTAVVWSEGTETVTSVPHVVMAVLDARGELLTPPITIGDPAQDAIDVRVAPADDGWALWITHSKRRRAIWMRVDDAGRTLAGPREVAQVPGEFVASNLLRFGQGYAAAYATFGGPAQLLFLNADGDLLRDPLSIGADAAGSRGMLVRDDELILAYTTSTGDLYRETISLDLRLARFDHAGNPVGAVRVVQAPKEDVLLQDPALARIGDDLALIWSEGRVMYTCAGCIPDNKLKFVVLDGADWSPHSDVLELDSPLPVSTERTGGLVQPRIDRNGEQLLLLSDLVWHTSADAVLAAVRCTTPSYF